MTRGAIDHYPAVMHPVGRGREPVDGDPVEVFQLRPGDVDRLTAWAGVSGYPGADGGVLLVDAGRVVGQVRLGDFVVRDRAGVLRVESSAAALFTAYQPSTRD